MFTSLGTLDIKYQSFERISLDFGAAELWVVMKSGMFYDVFVVNDCTGCVKFGRRSCTHHRFNDIILDTHKDCGKECRRRPRVFLSFFFFQQQTVVFPGSTTDIAVSQVLVVSLSLFHSEHLVAQFRPSLSTAIHRKDKPPLVLLLLSKHLAISLTLQWPLRPEPFHHNIMRSLKHVISVIHWSNRSEW